MNCSVRDNGPGEVGPDRQAESRHGYAAPPSNPGNGERHAWGKSHYRDLKLELGEFLSIAGF